MLTLICQKKNPLLHSYGLAGIDSVIHNDFDLYLEQMAEEIPAGPLPAIEDDFGFDPPMWPSGPGDMDRVSSSSANASIKSDSDDFRHFCASASQLVTTTESEGSETDVGCIYLSIGNSQNVEQGS